MEVKIEASEMKQDETRKRTRKGFPMVSKELEKLPIFDISLESGIHCLDWYDSDVSLIIDTETMMVGQPRNGFAWSFIWSGARSTYGFNTGKVYYEVKILEELKYTKRGEPEEIVNPLKEVRIGWSTNDSELVLGTKSTSFAYSSRSGKKLNEGKGEDYGELFGPGDVIGCYLEFVADDISMLYTKNGENQGNAFVIPASKLNGKALFPHVSTKGLKFEVNFGFDVVSTKQEVEEEQVLDESSISFSRGGRKKPWCNPLPTYSIAGNATSEKNLPYIEKWDDCEVLTMVGLPYCGKTTWANGNAESNPSKRINVIGMSQLLDRSEVDGQFLVDYLYKQENNDNPKFGADERRKCIDEWVVLALKRKRNVTIDICPQSYTSDYRWFKSAKGTVKKAIVIVPSDEAYKSRVDKAKEVNTKLRTSINTSINDKWIDNTISGKKCIFSLPPEDGSSPFNDVSYVELNKDEATALVEKYGKEAKEEVELRKETREKLTRDNELGRKKKANRKKIAAQGAPKSSLPYQGMSSMAPMEFLALQQLQMQYLALQTTDKGSIAKRKQEQQLQQQLIMAAREQEQMLKQQQLLAVVETQKQIIETMKQLKRPRIDNASIPSLLPNYSTGAGKGLYTNQGMNSNMNGVNGLDMRTAMQNIYSQGMLGNSNLNTSGLTNLPNLGNMGYQGMNMSNFSK